MGDRAPGFATSAASVAVACALAAILGSGVRAQDPPPIALGPPVRDEILAYELRLPAVGAARPPKGSWARFVHEIPTADGWGLVCVGVMSAGTTAEAAIAELRQSHLGAGFTALPGPPDGAPPFGAVACFAARDPRDSVCHHNFLFAAHDRLWRVTCVFREADAPLWGRRMAAVLPTFRSLGPPLDPTAAPALEGATRWADPALGLALTLPKESAVDRPPPAWASRCWKLPQANTGHGFCNVGFAEPGESPRAFRTLITGLFEEDGFAVVSEARAPDAPGGADEWRVYRRARDAETVRLALWLRPVGACALALAHAGSVEREWAWFAPRFLAGVQLTPPTGPTPERLPGTALGDPVTDEEFGLVFRMARGAKATPPPGGRAQREFQLVGPGGSNDVLTWTRGEEGETVEALLEAFIEGHQGKGLPDFRQVRRNVTLGTDGYLHLTTPAGDAELHFHFRVCAGRCYCLTAHHRITTAPAWRHLIHGLVLSFRGTRIAEVVFVPADGPAHAERHVRVRAAPKQVAPKVLQALAEAAQAQVDAFRALTGGPEPAERLAILCVGADALARRTGTPAGLEPPLAMYLPEARAVLFRAPAGKPDDACLGALAGALFAAYRDAWLGTPDGVPPWLAAGVAEAAQAPRRTPTGPVFEPKRAPVWDWVRKNRKTAEWPAADRWPRATKPWETAADRAFALALVLAAQRAEDPAVRGLLPRYCERLQARLDPDEAWLDATDGVDLAKLDTAARALLATDR